MLSLASGGDSTGSANSPTTSSQAARLLHSHNIAWCSQDTHSTRCWRKSHVSYRIPLTIGGRNLGIMEIGDLRIQSLKGRLLGLLNINSIEASPPAQSAWASNDVHWIGNSFCSCDNELVRMNSLGYPWSRMPSYHKDLYDIWWSQGLLAVLVYLPAWYFLPS